MDEEGNFITRNVKNDKEVKKIKLPKKNYKFVKFNPLNELQYFISTEESFKIYDMRTNLEIDSVEEFADSIDIFNDSSQFLTVKPNELSLYTFNAGKTEKQREWNTFGSISHLNMNSVNYDNPEVIILGNDNGDVYYSNLD